MREAIRYGASPCGRTGVLDDSHIAIIAIMPLGRGARIPVQLRWTGGVKPLDGG